MTLEKLQNRSGNTCELCSSSEKLTLYTVPSKTEESEENSILICNKCLSELQKEDELDHNHWRCLNNSMWSETPAVKVVVWRLLNQLRNETWANDLLETMYIEEDDLKWAKESLTAPEEEQIIHKDSNGVVLEVGDSVVLIKDLPVKGSSLIAKRGTTVRRILLDRENANHIEGRVDGQQIVILTQFVKKV